MYLVKNPSLLRKIFPSLLWKIKTKEKDLYLTFDDGPHPEITPWILDELDKIGAKATFFCVGKNAEKHPHVFNEIIKRGHSVGNHSYSHINGWKTSTNEFVENVEKCAQVFQADLFRPPYGKITSLQISRLKKRFKKIVMWTVISGDFNPKLLPEECLNIVIQNTDHGSIIVFHDSEKAEKNIRYVLPRVLNHFSQIGWRFKKI